MVKTVSSIISSYHGNGSPQLFFFFFFSSGLIREPKWSHFKELHAAVKLCTKPLLYGTKSNISLGIRQDVSLFCQYDHSMQLKVILANYKPIYL